MKSMPCVRSISARHVVSARKPKRAAVGPHAQHPRVRLVEPLAAVHSVPAVIGVPEGGVRAVAQQGAGHLALAVEARAGRDGEDGARLAFGRARQLGSERPTRGRQAVRMRRGDERQRGRHLLRCHAGRQKKDGPLADHPAIGGRVFRRAGGGSQPRKDEQAHPQRGEGKCLVQPLEKEGGQDHRRRVLRNSVHDAPEAATSLPGARFPDPLTVQLR